MENRDFNNYGGLSFTDLDDAAGEILTLCSAPMHLFKDRTRAILTVPVWKSVDSFNAFDDSTSIIKPFPLPETVFADYAEFFSPMFDNVFAWLGASSDTHDLTDLNIDLDALRISATAVSKTSAKWIVSRETSDLAEFEQVKLDYPQLVQGYFSFGWTYSKTNSAILAKFN